ncbi:MAG: hypothetical protein KF819_30265 [Labilithrix sp.]|nr:hypothetical protein [Labilithrix sp.]
MKRRFVACGIAAIVCAAPPSWADQPEVPLAASPTAPADLDTSSLFRAATDALAGDRPTDAIAALEALGDRGVVDPVISFDRGLAYAARIRAGGEQAGDLGRAAHGFEEARELSRDSALVADATAALEEVRAEVARRRARAGDPIELEHGVSLGRSIVRLLPENAWAILAVIASIALAVGIIVRARATAARAKVAGVTTCAIAGGLLALTAIILHSARDARLHGRDAVVIVPSTRLLDDKRVARASVQPLPEGLRVQLLDEGADFAHVIAGRVEGWLPTSAILPMAKR